MRRQRIRLRTRLENWPPKFYDQAFIGWTKNFIKENQWRVDTIHDFEDLLQECHIIFLKILERYPRVVDRPHIMSLYKTSVRNYFTDHARYMKRKNELHDYLPEDAATFAAFRIGELEGAGYLSILLQEAPEEVKLLLNAYSDETVLKKLREPQRRYKSERREGLSKRLCGYLGIGKVRLRLTGKDKIRAKLLTPDIVKQVQELLAS